LVFPLISHVACLSSRLPDLPYCISRPFFTAISTKQDQQVLSVDAQATVWYHHVMCRTEGTAKGSAPLSTRKDHRCVKDRLKEWEPWLVIVANGAIALLVAWISHV